MAATIVNFCVTALLIEVPVLIRRNGSAKS